MAEYLWRIWWDDWLWMRRLLCIQAVVESCSDGKCSASCRLSENSHPWHKPAEEVYGARRRCSYHSGWYQPPGCTMYTVHLVFNTRHCTMHELTSIYHHFAQRYFMLSSHQKCWSLIGWIKSCDRHYKVNT